MLTSIFLATPLTATLHAGVDPFALFFIGGSVIMLALAGYGVFSPDRPRVDTPADAEETAHASARTAE